MFVAVSVSPTSLPSHPTRRPHVHTHVHPHRYEHEERFAIEILDPELRVVTDANEWRHYRRNVAPAFGECRGVVEDEMISADLQVMLPPGTTVHIPFVFLSFCSGPVARTAADHGKMARAARGGGGSRGGDGERKGEGKSSGGGDFGEGKSSGGGGWAGDREEGGEGKDDRLSGQDGSRSDFQGWAGESYRGPGEPLRRRDVDVKFKSGHHGHVVKVVKVHVQPRPYVVHRELRFYQPENEYCKRCIKLHPSPPGAGNPYGVRPGGDSGDMTTMGSLGSMRMPHGLTATTAMTARPGELTNGRKFIHCPTSDVVVECKEGDGDGCQEMHFRYRCGAFPSVGQFFVLLYNDPMHASLYEVWHVTIHALLRVDVHSIMGQGSGVDLIVRGDQVRRHFVVVFVGVYTVCVYGVCARCVCTVWV